MNAPVLFLTATIAFVIGIAVARIGDEPVVVKPSGAEIKAAVLVDTAAVEMHGYDSRGEPGTFVYDCQAATPDLPGDPSLVCTQRTEAAK